MIYQKFGSVRFKIDILLSSTYKKTKNTILNCALNAKQRYYIINHYFLFQNEIRSYIFAFKMHQNILLDLECSIKLVTVVCNKHLTPIEHKFCVR